VPAALEFPEVARDSALSILHDVEFLEQKSFEPFEQVLSMAKCRGAVRSVSMRVRMMEVHARHTSIRTNVEEHLTDRKSKRLFLRL
jgi:hypothetical protein